MAIDIRLADDEADRFARDYRVQVRLAQLLTGIPSTEPPAGDDIVSAGILWREVLLPIANGTSQWRSPAPGWVVTPRGEALIASHNGGGNGKAVEAGATPGAPRKAIRWRKVGTRAEAAKPRKYTKRKKEGLGRLVA